jgi:hypothetical protein
VAPRTGLDDLEERKILPLSGLAFRPHGHLARSLSLYTNYVTPAPYYLSSVIITRMSGKVYTPYFLEEIFVNYHVSPPQRITALVVVTIL